MAPAAQGAWDGAQQALSPFPRCRARAPSALTAVLVAAAVGEAGGSVRGVEPARQAQYAGDSFRCLGATAGPALPSTAVNDDFCDCADGSDEPGTSACAGQRETFFYCPNEGSAAAYVYASRVNDGVCDCCDGSDEWLASAAGPGRPAPRSSGCTNTCSQEGRELLKERSKKEADLQSGIKQRRALIEAAKKERQKASEELERLRRELPSLEAKEREAQEAAEVARAQAQEEEKRLEEERGRAAAAAKPAAANATAAPKEPPAEAGAAAAGEGQAAAATLGAGAGAAETPTAPPAEGEPVVSEYAKWMDGADKAAAPPPAGDGAEAQPGAGGGAVISEYTKWMEGAEKALEGGEPPAAAAAAEASPDSDDGVDPEDDAELREAVAADGETARPTTAADAEPVEAAAEDTDAGLLQRWLSKARAAGARAWRRLFGETKTPVQRARDAAEKAHKEARDKVTETRKRLEELEKKAAANTSDDEEQLAYSGLDGRCISKKFAEYKYEVCFFAKAKQDSTSIGHWRRWEGPGVAVFEGGQYCPGGPERSLRVRFQCGSKEELVDISEPSRCAYEASITHPAACTEALLEVLKSQGPRLPTEEL